MTAEEFSYLKRFEENFRLAESAGYSRNISRNDRRRIREIVIKETGSDYAGNIYCSSCLVDMLLTVKKFYDKYKNKSSKKQLKKNENGN